MNKLSKRIQSLGESETLAMSKRSRQLQAKGYDIINLSIGQPDFFTPDFIKEAAKKALDDNITYYPPVAGFPSLRNAISEKLLRDNQLHYDPSQVVVSTGAKQAIANVMMSLVNPGDDVLVPVPYWVSYREIIRLAEGNPVYISTKIENQFKVTPEELEQNITDKTKVLIFSSPCNPTGSVYTHSELEAMAKVLEKHPHIYIISDEIYELINFTGKHESIAQFAGVKDRVIVINGVSKGFSMTGWRLGYLAADPEIACAAEKYQGQITSGANSVAQMAARAALEIHPTKVGETAIMRQAFEKRRNILIDDLQEIDGIKTYTPQGAFYIFPDVSSYFGKTYQDKTISNSLELADYLLEEALVAVVPGSAFGDPNCIRISYATSEKVLKEATKRISEALAKLS